MDKQYFVIAGNGVTSRANVDALLEDAFHAYGKKSEIVVIIPFKDKASPGQVFAAQTAKESGKEIIYISNSDTFEGLPPGSLFEAVDPYQEVCSQFFGELVQAFILWDDDSPEPLNILTAFSETGLACFDLTNGLARLEPSKIKIEDPEMPQTELIEAPTMEVIEEMYSVEDFKEAVAEEEPEDEDEEEEEAMAEQASNLYLGLIAIAEVIAPIFAKAIAQELRDALKTDSKGATA